MTAPVPPTLPRSGRAVLLAARFGGELTAGVAGVVLILGLVVLGLFFAVGLMWAFGCWTPVAGLGVFLLALAAGAVVGGCGGFAGGLVSAATGVWLAGAVIGVAVAFAAGYGVGDGLWHLGNTLPPRTWRLGVDTRTVLQLGFAAVGPVGGLFGAFTALNPDAARRWIDRTRGR